MLSITPTGISLAVEDDDYFELMIRNALKPTGGADAVEDGMGLGMGTGARYKSMHATARRVLVVHGDGREEVIGERRLCWPLELSRSIIPSHLSHPPFFLFYRPPFFVSTRFDPSYCLIPRRFCVIMSAELVDDDVDLDHFGMNHIVARLDAQGVKDISDIRILKQ